MNNLAPAVHRQTYTIATINLNTIRTVVKYQLLREMLRASDADLALLQEVSIATLPDFYGYMAYMTSGDQNGSGTAILIRDGINVEDVTYLPSARGLAITALGTRIINVYAPSGTDKRQERSQFYVEEIAPLFLGRYDHCILGGDYNCVLHPKDQIPHFSTCPELRLVVRDLQLIDTWEKIHGERPGHTYLTSHSASHLDRIYVSQNLGPGVLDAERWPLAFSDHSAFICTVTLQRQQIWQSRGHWELNVAHLQDPECQELIAAAWANCERRLPRYQSTLEWWIECAKPAGRRVLIQYGKDIAAWNRHTLDFYYTILREFAAQPPTQERQMESRRLKRR